MEFIDLHARFRCEKPERFGYARVCAEGVEVLERSVKGAGELGRTKPEKGKVNILSSPDPEALAQGARRFDVLCSTNFVPDTGMIRKASEEERPFEIPIAFVLDAKGLERARIIARMAFFLKLCNKLGAGYVITSRAGDELEMRRPLDIAAFAEVALGISRSQALMALSAEPLALLEKVR
ncbi:MAG: RNase P subunit p30 family protein [Candidatus Micrarchaeia archaeon]